MSQLFVDNIKGRTGGAIGAPSGVNVTGVVTATTFDGNVTGGTISGTTGTFSGNVSIGGTLTYEDVTNIDAVGIVTAQQGIRIGTGGTVNPAGAGIVTYYGDGQYLQNIISGVTVQEEGSSLSNAATTLNFVGDNVTASGSGGTKTITISGGSGITTTASSPAANTTVILNLGTAQHHDITLTAGITTITCTGGTMGDSHSIVLTQPSSGIATVGFSTYFLFPSGAAPSMSEGGSKVDLVSFVIRTQGYSGVATALLASAGLNYQ